MANQIVEELRYLAPSVNMIMIMTAGLKERGQLRPSGGVDEQLSCRCVSGVVTEEAPVAASLHHVSR